MNRSHPARGLLAATAVTGLLTATSCAPSHQHATGAAGRAPAVATTAEPPEETLEPLLEQALPGVKGKTFTSALVTFPPGGRAAPHRHGTAFVYAYVLEGSFRSRLAGEPVRTYRRGDSWTEQPGAHHVLTENTSGTQPGRLLVIFISDTGSQLKTED
ncbi:cupin domain-containing protein [Nonomuraea sp. NPDC049421]|uniref:cupin domain-containing protein n=1 Tax=Nonomuraea sp. NPDC049421 TaxID=3155275 RepID=UPI0034371CDC